MADREQTLHRARQIHIDHPEWGRRRINAQLRSELGAGLRDATVDAVTLPQRERIARGEKPVFVKKAVRDLTAARAMKNAGFISFEINGVTGSPAVPLGQISTDSAHPLFVATMRQMIKERSRMFESFKATARKRGWPRQKTNRLWIKKIQRHYKEKNFPVIGKGLTAGGSLLTPEGDPSPWALYKAFEKRVIKSDPLGGEGWGTPRPQRGARKSPPKLTITSDGRDAEIARQKKFIDTLNVRIKLARGQGDTAAIKSLEGQRKRLLGFISELRSR